MQGKLAPQKVTSIMQFDPVPTLDSIFMVKSLLVAIVKDCAPISDELATTILALRKDITNLQTTTHISEFDFSSIDTEFYAILARLKDYQRLTKIIFEQKLPIERVIRQSLKQGQSCIPILRLYDDVLTSIQSHNPALATHKLFELANILEVYTAKVGSYYSEFS